MIGMFRGLKRSNIRILAANKQGRYNHRENFTSLNNKCYTFLSVIARKFNQKAAENVADTFDKIIFSNLVVVSNVSQKAFYVFK